MVWSRVLFKRQEMSRQTIRFKEKRFQIHEGWLWSNAVRSHWFGKWLVPGGSPCWSLEWGCGCWAVSMGRLPRSFPWRALQHWQQQTAGREEQRAWPALGADVSRVCKCNSAWMLMGKASVEICTNDSIGRGKYFLAYTVPIFCL